MGGQNFFEKYLWAVGVNIWHQIFGEEGRGKNFFGKKIEEEMDEQKNGGCRYNADEGHAKYHPSLHKGIFGTFPYVNVCRFPEFPYKLDINILVWIV